MININVNVGIPFLWGSQFFRRTNWGFINFIIGPNGTGKTIFATYLVKSCKEAHLKARYVNAERIEGQTKFSSWVFSGSHNVDKGFDLSKASAFRQASEIQGAVLDTNFIIQNNLSVKIRIEATLSKLFGRRLRLAQQGGFLAPKMQKILGGAEYSVRDAECSGLKELISLLVLLYHEEYNCLIIDEPELHLHPQFQSFFLQEIRRIAGNPFESPSKKVIFLITHSPYFIDVRTIEELKCCIIFHQNGNIPTYVDDLSASDEYKIKRFLPRLNVHHKQLFFSSSPIFVEGYTDQQIFSLLLEKEQKIITATGSSIIDVGGKEEVDAFYRLCKHLKINATGIVDLDAIEECSLRSTIVQSDIFNEYISEQGVTSRSTQITSELFLSVDYVINELKQQDEKNLPQSYFKDLILQIKNVSSLKQQRRLVLIGIQNNEAEIISCVNDKSKISFIKGRLNKIIEGFERAGVYVLKKGAVENYYVKTNKNPYFTGEKDKLFIEERDYILDECIDFKNDYNELFQILNKAIKPVEIDLRTHLKFVVIEWMQKIKLAFIKREISNIETLKVHSDLNYTLINQVFDVISFDADFAIGEFTCSFKIKDTMIANEPIITFNQRTLEQEIWA